MKDPDRLDREENERLVADARRVFREGAGELDAATLSRLNRARQRALDELDRGSRAAWPVGWRPAAALGAAALLAVAIWAGRESPGVVPPAAEDQALDLEVVLADDSLELIGDLEFYDWLPEAGNPDGLTG